MEDTLWSSLTDSYAKLPMALTAEKLGEKYGLTREDCDKFAMTSQERWQEGVCVCLCVLCVCACVCTCVMFLQKSTVEDNL